jgi:hypothetical protein
MGKVFFAGDMKSMDPFGVARNFARIPVVIVPITTG